MTARVHAVTPYGRTAGSSRVRVFQWMERSGVPGAVNCYLGQRNSSPGTLLRSPRALLAAERDLRTTVGRTPERLLLHREASPLSRGRLETRLLRSAQFSVYDFDDALQWDNGEGGVLRKVAPKAPKALAAVHAADRVIAGNQVLADWAGQHARDVVVIPSCVALEEYDLKDDHSLADPPQLVWIGSRSEEIQLLRIAPALSEVAQATGARLLLIGEPQPTLGALEAHIDRVPWSEAAQRDVLATGDVGLMPLRDVPIDRGKCGYKLLQYLAAGLPAVASPVGVNAEILQRSGMPAAERQADWVDALTALLGGSAATRSELGARGRRAVEQHYSYDTWLPAWRRALELGEPA